MAIKELFYDERPVALLNPRASQRIDPRFKFTRNSTATYVDRDGVLRPNGAPAGEPRFDYDFETKEYRGLLLEPGATNIATRGDNPDQYSQNGGIRTANDTAAPDGTLRAAKFEYDTEAGFSQFYLDFTSSVAATNAGTYTYSVYLKGPDDQPDGYYGGRIVLLSSTGQGNKEQPVALTKEWKRYYVTKTFTTETGNIRCHPIIFRGTPGSVYDGRVIPSYVWIWATQIEQGSVSTSYIPTSVGQASRAADLLGLEVPVPATGSVYIDARAIGTVKDDTLISLKNASNQKINLAMEERSELYNSLALTYSIKGTVKPTLPYPVPTTNRERNIITWGTNNYQYNTDGARFAPSLSTTPGIPANLIQLSIGHDAVDPTKAFNGYINAVYLYNGEITPTVAEALVRGELDPINADTYSPVGPTGSLALIINTQGASSSGDKVFALPAESALNDNDIVITWGDGTESGLDGAAAELGAAGLSHTYPSAGIYPIWVEGKLENLQFNNSASAPDLVKIEAWGTTANGNDVFLSPSTMNSAFYGCSKLTSMPSSGLPDTSAVTNWYRAFRGCSSLTGTFPSFNFSAATTFSEAFYGCSSLTSFTAAGDQTQNVTSFYYAWYGCSGLTSFPLINTSAGGNFNSAWRECSGLTSFPSINTTSATDFSATWMACSGLTSFPLLSTASVSTFAEAWLNCSGLTAFPLINTSSGTNFFGAWRGCTGLTSFPLIDTSSGTNLGSAWRDCASLTSFPLLDTSASTSFANTWNNCNSLTSFPLINTSASTNFVFGWTNCSSLTSFPLIDTSSGTNVSYAWYNCNSLTSFPALDLSAVTGLASDASTAYTGFRDTWYSCSSLTDFPANRFDTSACTRFVGAWFGCALTAASIENILVSINTANTSDGNLSLNGGTNAGASTWTANAVTAYNALVARGWTITRNA